MTKSPLRLALCFAVAALVVTPIALARAGSKALVSNVTVTAGQPAEFHFVVAPSTVKRGVIVFKITNKGTFAKNGFYSNRWDIGEHHGTHLDSPSHCSPGITAEKIDPSSFVAPAAVIDIRERQEDVAQFGIAFEGERVLALGMLPEGDGRDPLADLQTHVSGRCELS